MAQDNFTDFAPEPLQPESPTFAEKVGEFFLETFKTILLALLIYGSATGCYSRRKIERAT